jgi:hypothetical protein
VASGIDSPVSAADLLAMNNALVGASTGFMEALRGRWSAMTAQARTVSDHVVELSALSGRELPALLAFLADPEDLGGFAAVSVHGPSKAWCGTDAELAAALASLPALVDGIVMHPETLRDVAAYRELGSRLWLENMDTRKDDARTTDELWRYFEALPEARFCFDIAHAWLHDSEMTLAHDLLDAFGDRLAEVHVSSIRASGEHVPLAPDVVGTFAPVLERCIGVPWTLEAPPPGAA